MAATIRVNRLPDDVLRVIFVHTLPNLYLYPSLVHDTSPSSLFATIPPHNISRVCRSWRNIILSSPSLWSSFLYSLSNPSQETLVVLICSIGQHLKYSCDLPLTFFVRIGGNYDCSLSEAIVSLLSKHQHRWRKVGIWFETETYKRDACFLPVPETELNVEDLTLLEELHISFSTEYFLASSTGRSLRNSLPSLTRLDLHTLREQREAMRWLDLAPNLKELNLKYGPNYISDYATHPSYPGPLSFENVIPQIHMTHLRTASPAQRTTPPVEFMLEHMTCPALEELHVHLDMGLNSRPFQTLHEFFRRSMPSALETAYFSITGELLGPDSVIRVDDVLAFMPSLRTFGIRWINTGDDVDAALIVLAGTSGDLPASDPSAVFILLPGLEELEIVHTLVPQSSFIEFVLARCGGSRSSFKCVKLIHCSLWADGFLVSKRFPDFNSVEDLSCLPAEWMALKGPIEEGLRFAIEN